MMMTLSPARRLRLFSRQTGHRLRLPRKMNLLSSDRHLLLRQKNRVALHCKGCEGKVRKHISKMEGETGFEHGFDLLDSISLFICGVTSFDIDFEAKKVTVVGAVTASGVLNSISKVQNAQLWPSSPPFLPSSSSSSCFHGT
ncbi:hypothetical protein C4D60_Mb10t04470 [Musa balbisiana]|uniref:HMA domain-containing protein n=1 Tax=Musa balbisiana TaxID=52838 RepID=A0A4S8IUQ9_MUSBA|nr:hypothetical protein C4D60_Mb10t04470 [Musa balbisiana]